MDDSRFDLLARAFSRRIDRRALLASLGFAFPAQSAAAKRKRLRLGKTCDGLTDKCQAGECIDGVCACAEDEEPCRGRCVPLDTCCPRRRPRRCGNQCIPKKACCRADNECPCGGGCIRCGQCCTDADCDAGPDGCWYEVCRNRRCEKITTPGLPCGVLQSRVCTNEGVCGQRECSSSADCPGTIDECQHPTCESGRCGTFYASEGTPRRAQTPGDCKTAVCDGRGGTAFWHHDDDRPQASAICPEPRCVDGHLYCS